MLSSIINRDTFRLKSGTGLAFVLGLAMISLFALVWFKGGHRDRHSALVGLLHEAAFSGIGMSLFLKGFDEIRKKRLVEDTPTSPVRSVALGLAEVAGLAAAKELVESPYSRTRCVFFRYLKEKEVRRRKSKGWEKEDEGCSTNCFYVEDGTGRLLVDPLEAETILVQDYRHTDGGGLFSARRRYTEWYICPGDYVYVLGSVKKHGDAAADRKHRLAEKIRALKADRERLTACDVDGDGQVDTGEWDRAVARMEQELQVEDMRAAGETRDELVMGRGEIEDSFLIADRDEKDVLRFLTGKCALLVFGGGLLLGGMLCSLSARGGLLPSWCAIPWSSFY